MNDKDINLVFHGPLAEHDAKCLIYGCDHPAVFEYGSPGHLQPCWACQKKGWKLELRPKHWWQFWRRNDD